MSATRTPFAFEDDDHDHVVNLGGRPFRRTLAIAGAIALVVIVGYGSADATPPPQGPMLDLVVGHLTLTSQEDCPEGLQVEVLIRPIDGGWSLTAEPYHAGCSARTDLPLKFEGEWDPSGESPCVLSTGARCFRRVDGPGRLSVGAVPMAHRLTRATMTYVQGMLQISGTATLMRFSGTGPPPATPVSLVGFGEVTPPGCSNGAYKVPFAAGTDGGGVWVVARPAAVGVTCAGVTYGGPATLIGTWDPGQGGCITSSGAKLCIAPMPHRGVTNGVAMTWCPDIQCFTGDAWLARL